MNNLIIYGSQYGTTKRYAEKMSEMTGIPLINYENIKDLSEYDTIIHFGGLYAGGVKGLKSTIKALPENARLIIVTVGVADVTDKANTDHIKQSISRQISKEIYEKASIFHLRGGIDYQKLNFKHKTLMTLLYKKVKSLPDEKKTAEDRTMIETFNQKVDFVDFDSLKPIIEGIY